MRTIFIAILAILAFTPLNASLVTIHQSNSYIIFEHVGITDKPINTVIIAKSKAHLPNAFKSVIFKYFIDNELFTKSETIVLNTKKSKETQEFGNFKILIINGNEKLAFFIAREDAVNLFKSLHALYKREKLNTELPLMMDELKTRIYY